MSILLYGHGGSGNHGCEAIVRSTSSILKHTFGNPEIVLSTHRAGEDNLYIDGVIDEIIDMRERKKNLDYIFGLMRLKLTGDYVPFDIYPYRSLIRKGHKIGMALSIGGDNYCYGDSSVLRGINSLLRSKGIKTVLWGCSIEPAALVSDVIADLNNYSLIIARESISYEAIRSSGVNNVLLYPDPAFSLPTNYSCQDVKNNGNNFVGINLSPYVSKCERSSGLTIHNFKAVVKYIIDETDLNVALIPHVVWKHSDDRIPLQELYEEFSDSGRVVMYADDNAERLKGIISKCRFMVAARTHASIAAYSTCVPTLVVGYSVKAKGIAKDIFGSYDDYVLPVQDLASPNDLSKKFKWLMDHENEIRKHLSTFMPGYIARAWQAGEALKKI
ncbi:MAG: polysaccharide pyruvyl transferase family protein [Bacteroidales bacterium]|nr:polysaccharide pyruvyl transferase family protein [Bacteroidales bacterium]